MDCQNTADADPDYHPVLEGTNNEDQDKAINGNINSREEVRASKSLMDFLGTMVWRTVDSKLAPRRQGYLSINLHHHTVPASAWNRLVGCLASYDR